MRPMPAPARHLRSARAPTRRSHPAVRPLLAAAAALTLTTNAVAQERGGFLDLNGYWDDRSFTTLTVNTLANLPRGLQYFAFVNYTSPTRASSTDLDGFYSEHHVRWAVGSTPFDLTALWAPRSGTDNDPAYLGVRWRPSDSGGLGRALRGARVTYAVNLHLARFGAGPEEGWAPQLEHAYRWDAVPGRIYLTGFADHNLWFGGPDGSPRSRTVSEHQAGWRLVDRLYAVVEWRLNQYLPEADRTGVGFGVQYLIPFVVRP